MISYMISCSAMFQMWGKDSGLRSESDRDTSRADASDVDVQVPARGSNLILPLPRDRQLESLKSRSRCATWINLKKQDRHCFFLSAHFFDLPWVFIQGPGFRIPDGPASCQIEISNLNLKVLALCILL